MGSPGPDVYYYMYTDERADVEPLYTAPRDGYNDNYDDVNNDGYYDDGTGYGDNQMGPFQQTMIDSMREAYRHTDASQQGPGTCTTHRYLTTRLRYKVRTRASIL